jgi:hypothetical protein
LKYFPYLELADVRGVPARNNPKVLRFAYRAPRLDAPRVRRSSENGLLLCSGECEMASRNKHRLHAPSVREKLEAVVVKMRIGRPSDRSVKRPSLDQKVRPRKGRHRLGGKDSPRSNSVRCVELKGEVSAGERYYEATLITESRRAPKTKVARNRATAA